MMSVLLMVAAPARTGRAAKAATATARRIAADQRLETKRMSSFPNGAKRGAGRKSPGDSRAFGLPAPSRVREPGRREWGFQPRPEGQLASKLNKSILFLIYSTDWPIIRP